MENTCSRVFADQAQIADCKEKIKLKEKSLNRLSQVLDLAGNNTRLKILYLLEQEQELCPCDISDIIGISIPAVSQHLRKLKDANIVQIRKAGQTFFYSLKTEHLKILQPFFHYIDDLSPVNLDV
ncbi:MAG: ArsR/SmtB family transcription factor [Bacteroidota bacterium]